MEMRAVAAFLTQLMPPRSRAAEEVSIARVVNARVA